VYHQAYRVLSKEMHEKDLDLHTVQVTSRLESGLTLDHSREIWRALGLNAREQKEVDLYELYRERAQELLEPLREVLSLIEDRAGEPSG